MLKKGWLGWEFLGQYRLKKLLEGLVRTLSSHLAALSIQPLKSSPYNSSGAETLIVSCCYRWKSGNIVRIKIST